MSLADHSVQNFCFFEIYRDGSKDINLTTTLGKIIITNDIDNGYPVIQLFYKSDNQKFIQDNIFGHKNLSLIIWYTDVEGKPMSDPLIFDLIVLENNVPLTPKSYNNVSNYQDIQRRTIISTCICKQSFQIMSTTVNRLWECGICPYDAAIELIKDTGISSTNIECYNKNTYTMGQLLIPPMSLNKALDEINDRYGIYENQVFKYMKYNGTFEMWDIVKHFENNINGEIIIHKLPNVAPDSILRKPQEYAEERKNHFITYDTIETINTSNDSCVLNGFKQTHIYHPSFDIAYYINTNYVDESKNRGLLSKSNDIKINTAMSNRLIVNNSMRGLMETDDSNIPVLNPIYRRMSKEFMKLNQIRINLVRQIKIHELMNVGHTLYLKPYSEHETYEGSNYEGTYLITNSVIILNRERQGGLSDQIYMSATITASRTNQSYN